MQPRRAFMDLLSSLGKKVILFVLTCTAMVDDRFMKRGSCTVCLIRAKQSQMSLQRLQQAAVRSRSTARGVSSVAESHSKSFLCSTLVSGSPQVAL